ncbi:hypothetical protein D3C80_1694480 [compost metagenome]
MLPAEHEVGHHDKDWWQHRRPRRQVNRGVHHLLYRFGTKAVNHQHHEHEGKLPPCSTYRNAMLVQLGGFLAVNAFRDLGEVDLHRRGGPHHHRTKNGDE